MTAGNQKELRQQCLDTQRADMLARYPMMDPDLMLAFYGEDPCFAALAPAMSELLLLLVVDPPAALEKIREHLKITPKRKIGAPTKPINDQAWDLFLQGYAPAEFCRKLQVPKEDQKRVKSAVRTRLRDLDPDPRAAVWQQIHATLRWQHRNELRKSRLNQKTKKCELIGSI